MKISESIRSRIREALAEDIGEGDFTTRWTLPGNRPAEARVLAKQDGVVFGGSVFGAVYEELDRSARLERIMPDGAKVGFGDEVIRLQGPVQSILTGERTALNFLGRLSGIATLTRSYVDAVGNLPVSILGTRKTTPLWRELERAAIRAGGGRDHRFGLFDMVLIKDNHIDGAGSVREAIRRARTRNTRHLLIEVEARSLDEVKEALEENPDLILLDNMDVETLRRAVEMCRGRVRTEASGGIHLNNVRTIAETGVDRISVGALTHSAPALDYSMVIEPRPPHRD